MKSFWVIGAIIMALGSTYGYASAVSKGKVMDSPKAEFIPKSQRDKPGGYRSFHFWHIGTGGYRGGK